MKNRFRVLALFIIGGIIIIGCSPTTVPVGNSSAESIDMNISGGSLSVVEAESTLPVPNTATPTSEPQPDQEAVETAVEIDPFADPASIVATLNDFAAMQEAIFIGQPGWIFVKRTELLSLDRRDGDYSSHTGDSIPFEELVPAESPTFESWYHVDETGVYYEGLGLVTSADGAVHQHSVLLDGQWIQITLLERGFPYTHSRQDLVKVDLPTSYIAQWLEGIHELPEVNLTAYLADGHYVVVQESTNEEPHAIGSLNLPGPVIGNKLTYTFDPQTGQLLNEAVYYQLKDGSLLLTTEITVHVEFVPELPPERAPLYYDTVNELKNE